MTVTGYTEHGGDGRQVDEHPRVIRVEPTGTHEGSFWLCRECLRSRRTLAQLSNDACGSEYDL